MRGPSGRDADPLKESLAEGIYSKLAKVGAPVVVKVGEGRKEICVIIYVYIGSGPWSVTVGTWISRIFPIFLRAKIVL